MPRPVFIVCASDAVIDRYTNSLSLFKVIETLQYREGHPGSEGQLQQPIQFKVVATWASEEGNRDVPFEHELVITCESSGEKIVSQVPFVFQADNHRFFVTTGIGLQSLAEESRDDSKKNRTVLDDGGVWIISRIREEGSRQWFTQKYFLRIEKLSPDQAESEAGNHAGREPI